MSYQTKTVEELIEKFRPVSNAVESLHRAHIKQRGAGELDLSQAESAIKYLNGQVVLAANRGDRHIEYLYCEWEEDGVNWYSITKTADRNLGPIALYRANVSDRLDEYPITAERIEETPFGELDVLPEHGLDVEEDGVMLDA